MDRKIESYVNIEYDVTKRPLTDYPRKLAIYLANRYDLRGKNLLEAGVGRGEVLMELATLGVECSCIDRDPIAIEQLLKQCKTRGLKIDCILADAEMPLHIRENFYDIIYTKSFLEHLHDPVSFLRNARTKLVPTGIFLNLIPDWESQHTTYFDDITHKTPFTTETIRQVRLLAGLQDIKVEKFRQLPATWKYPILNSLAALISPLVRPRTKSKTLRWSRELMILSTATSPETGDV